VVSLALILAVFLYYMLQLLSELTHSLLGKVGMDKVDLVNMNFSRKTRCIKGAVTSRPFTVLSSSPGCFCHLFV